MIPLIETEVVDKHKWIDRQLFLDLIAVAQTCPGVFAINVSVFIGYRLKGLKGAILTSLGAAMPSIMIILAIAMFFQNFQHIPWVASMFAGIRPAVVALMAVPTFNMARKAKISWFNCWIPIVSALLIWMFGVNPIYIILAAGIGGLLYGRIFNKEKGK